MSAEVNPKIHNNIKALRNRAKKKQKEVAQDLGINLERYRAWEQQKRNPRGDMAAIVADYFGVTMDTLLGSKQAAPFPPTTEEQRLLDAYRQLDDADKATVARVVYALLDTAEDGGV